MGDMPEPIEQPEQTPQPAPVEAPVTPAKVKKAPGATALARLKKKYRLDDIVRLDAVDENGQKLGRGPLMAPETFDKLAEIDPTTDKRYLDWMLFMAGGGPTAFRHSLEMWGESTKELNINDVLGKFNREVVNRIGQNDVASVTKRLKENAEIDVPQLVQHTNDLMQAGQKRTERERYAAVMDVLNQNNIGTPDKRERIARELLSHKLKQWIRDQLDTKVRDRTHVVFVFNRVAQGMDPAAAEREWRENEPKRKREYVLGDQDALRWMLFGFSRNWPGKENRYEKVHNTMREFLVNKTRVERRNTQLDQYNAAIQAKNKTLPPGEQLPLREPINVSLDIGKITLDRKGNLAYKGAYDSIDKLAKANEAILDMPMRERVSSDIRYSGPKGKVGRSEKVYSDNFVDVLVPLTVAAAVKGGHPSWKISEPEQLEVSAKGRHDLSTWSRWAAGEHSYHEWESSQIIPVFFNFKLAGIENFRLLLMVFLEDLTQLQPPYMGTLWRMPGDDEEHRFADVVKQLKNKLGDQYHNAMRSLSKGLKAVREWGQEFDPRFMVGDYVGYHREKMSGRRGLREEVFIRASQVVALLTE